MITVTEKKTSHIGFVKSNLKDIVVKCEECLAPISVWTHQIRQCPYCYTPIPDMVLMKGDLKYRIVFHYGREKD